MPNKARGESAFLAGGEQYVMKLTLGALAEIENVLGVKSLSEIGTRLQSLGSGDIAAIASALLRGGGFQLTPADVLKLETDLGTLVGAITDAFDAVGLTRSANTGTDVSAAPRESKLHAENAEARRESSGPLAGNVSSSSASA